MSLKRVDIVTSEKLPCSFYCCETHKEINVSVYYDIIIMDLQNTNMIANRLIIAILTFVTDFEHHGTISLHVSCLRLSRGTLCNKMNLYPYSVFDCYTNSLGLIPVTSCRVI